MQKLIFLCGCLEPGKDGVGDYTRTLAAEIARHSIQLQLISLSDPFVEKREEKITTNQEGMAIQEVRFPATQQWLSKSDEIRSLVEQFNPDIISVQLVPFVYNPYGILKNSLPYFRKITQGFRTQLMFHELWIGDEVGVSMKNRIIGYLGKRYILKLIRSIQPFNILTTSDLNVFLLGRAGVNAFKLPVFSNIPFYPAKKASEDILEMLGIKPEQKSQYLIFTFFGSIHPEWNSTYFFQALQNFKKAKGKEILLLSIGRTSEESWENLKKKNDEHFTFVKLGELSPEKISLVLQQTDYGISSYPDILVEKSGSIAAMRLHGLPVILSRKDLQIKGFSMDNLKQPLLIKIDDLILSDTHKMASVDGIRQMFDVKFTALRYLEMVKIPTTL